MRSCGDERHGAQHREPFHTVTNNTTPPNGKARGATNLSRTHNPQSLSHTTQHQAYVIGTSGTGLHAPIVRKQASAVSVCMCQPSANKSGIVKKKRIVGQSKRASLKSHTVVIIVTVRGGYKMGRKRPHHRGGTRRAPQQKKDAREAIVVAEQDAQPPQMGRERRRCRGCVRHPKPNERGTRGAFSPHRRRRRGCRRRRRGSAGPSA